MKITNEKKHGEKNEVTNKKIKEETKNKSVSEEQTKKRYQGYNKNNTILQITISGMLVALAVLVGVYGHFTLGGGGVYLLAAVVFLFPLFLRLPFVVLTTAISCVVTDWATGWIAFTWITLIAYGGAVMVVWLFQLTNKRYSYFIGTLLGSVYLVLVYMLIEMVVPAYGVALALKDAIATTVQMAICVPIVWILYFPMKTVAQTIKI
ncbi:hypothetical protein [Mycoplasma todarodis]|uniref:ECF transporter S component n=1 Tax=Mycoplasma todarodis TaxID=1937191 RepID=A0A4R0XTU8_9MOLU|nr:hypothetical protein [Mycoplasma todarodis]TCG11207.1 hypothetical protein C4B25_02080 [Mycoplasma todarodis]